MTAHTNGVAPPREATGSPATADRLQWLMDELVERLDRCDRAVLVSADGLLTARSSALDNAGAERLAAITSALHSLARSAGAELAAGRVRQTFVELEGAYLLVTTGGRGTSIAVVVPVDTDLGQVAFAVNRMVRQVGPHLAVEERRPDGETGDA